MKAFNIIWDVDDERDLQFLPTEIDIPDGMEDDDEISERWILERDEVFRYQLLSRMKMDCEFFLGFGNRMEKYLWAGSVAFQIECMKSIWDSFPADGKPEWLTVEQIENYERRMAE